jgi:hypothetical protein
MGHFSIGSRADAMAVEAALLEPGDQAARSASHF